MADTATLYHQRMMAHPEYSMEIGEVRSVPCDDALQVPPCYGGHSFKSYSGHLYEMGRWFRRVYKLKRCRDMSLRIERLADREAGDV